ncbi:MAG: hypothetical protein FJZ10_00555 [Candidatus Omnitrophica bacterium]|nr:hypothetical protein [Candidatus Omnitrophota bacterium]
MLKALRKKDFAKKVFYVLAAIIIPAFVLWGSGNLLRNKLTSNFAGKIFNKTISLEQFQESLAASRNQAILKFGENFFKLQKFINLEREAWDRLILLYEVKKRKISISDNEVIEAIKKIPYFQSNGQFEPRIYQYFLDSVFHTPARVFEEQARESLMFGKLYNEITDKITLSEGELLESYKKENEKIKIGYVGFLTKDFENKVTVEEKEIKDYFDAHSSDFTKPPSINIQYAGLSFPEQQTEEDKRNVVDKITGIYSKVAGEQDLQKIAKQNSLDFKETGFFSLEGTVPGIGIELDFVQTAFSLVANQISKPVATAKGIYLLKLKEKKDSYIPTFEEAKASVEKVIKTKKAMELASGKAKEYLAKLEDIHKTNPNNFNFQKTLESEALAYKESPLFNYGQYIPDIGVSKEFLDEAFGLRDKNKVFGFVSTEQGSYIMRLLEAVPIDEKKFTEEKEAFKEKLLQQKKEIAFNNFFLELKGKARLIDNIPKIKAQAAKGSPNIPQIDEF